MTQYLVRINYTIAYAYNTLQNNKIIKSPSLQQIYFKHIKNSPDSPFGPTTRSTGQHKTYTIAPYLSPTLNSNAIPNFKQL